MRSVLPGGKPGRAIALALSVVTLPVLWLDLVGNRRVDSSTVASTTFVLAQKTAPH